MRFEAVIHGSRVRDGEIHIKHHHTPPYTYLRPAALAIEMPPSCNCLGGALKTLRPSPALRRELDALRITPRRTFAASHRPNTAIASRLVAKSDSSCLLRTRNVGQQGQGLVGSLRKPLPQSRPFSNSTPRSALKTIEQVRARNKGGVRSLSTNLHLQIHHANLLCDSPSISPPQSSSSAPQADFGPTSHTRRNVWHGNG